MPFYPHILVIIIINNGFMLRPPNLFCMYDKPQELCGGAGWDVPAPRATAQTHLVYTLYLGALLPGGV